MRLLFLHNNFPGQFPHVARSLAAERGNEVVFATMQPKGEIPGVRKVLWAQKRGFQTGTHPFLQSLERATGAGEAMWGVAQELKQQGFVPDVVYGHSGWGAPQFIKDVFPDAKLLCYFEWFYHAHGSDVDFDPSTPVTPAGELRARLKNGPLLLDLDSCDRGLSPTHWQRTQFPPEWRRKIDVISDGFDTDVCHPKPNAKLHLRKPDLDLRQAKEIVTYVAWGLEPYRGFPQFMQALAKLQKRRPQLHAVIVAEDRVVYGRQREDGRTWKEEMPEELDLDLNRIHFTGMLPHSDYVKVLQASSVHVYLTRPFVLSWSMMEALSTGCLLVASNTATVTEIVEDGDSALLVDFFDVEAIAARVEEALERRDELAPLRRRARELMLERYSLKKNLPLHLDWIRKAVDA